MMELEEQAQLEFARAAKARGDLFCALCFTSVNATFYEFERTLLTPSGSLGKSMRAGVSPSDAHTLRVVSTELGTTLELVKQQRMYYNSNQNTLEAKLRTLLFKGVIYKKFYYISLQENKLMNYKVYNNVIIK